MGVFWRLGRPLLFMIEPERAHHLAINALKSGLAGVRPVGDRVLQLSVAGLAFPNPLGLAAGFDKNAEVPDAVLRSGFGFTEIGTVTPLPQVGNIRPRLFRLVKDQAVINRMGFNNAGHAAVCRRLAARGRQGIVGVNIGANRNSGDRIADYIKGIEHFYAVSDYFTINISSPNTPGLRDLQTGENLRQLLDAVLAARGRQMERAGRPCPVFLKIAPDLAEKELDDIAEEVLSSKLDGLIISNTTVSRTGLTDHKRARESGGLSGLPLFQRSTIVLARMRRRLGSRFPIIGVGGVHDTATALEKIKAGADLLQLYTGLVYQGPGMVTDILKGFITVCRRDGVDNIAKYRDRNLEKWADQNMDI